MSLFEQKVGEVGTPYFLRKVDKRSYWGCENDNKVQRLEHAIAEVFGPPGTSFSLYRVANDVDLRSVVVGLNSLRPSPRQQIDFVKFTNSEIESAQIRLNQTPGTTECFMANGLHVDALLDRNSSVQALCRLAFDAGREVFRITKSDASTMWQQATDGFCRATTDKPPFCRC